MFNPKRSVSTTAAPTCYDVLCRVATHEGKQYPCIFIPAYPVNYGRIMCFDNEGHNEADTGYYQETKPAYLPEHIAECDRLIALWNSYPGEPTTVRKVKRLNWNALRQSWQR